MYSKKHIILTIVATCLMTASLCFGITLRAIQPMIDELNKEEDILVQAKTIITENYVNELTPYQVGQINNAAISAMVRCLGDPYSYYFDMEAFGQYEENNKEEYVGIGVNVSYETSPKTLTVTAPTAGGPAEKAGILPQDLIIGVDELTLADDGYNAIIDYIKGGNKGDVVQIHIDRDGKLLTFDVMRDVISIETITFKMLDKEMAYIKISEFQHNSVEDFKKALDEVQANNAKGLIIDLRNNPGGYAESVIEMTDMLLPEGTIAYLEDNKGNKEYFKSDKDCIDIPMVVLVNEGTASAAELMSGSLQAYELASIVGMKTYGKAVGQSVYMLTESTAIYLTSARYYTPKGECIDKKGITPDVEIDLPEELKPKLNTLSPEEDVQLQKGIEALAERMK